MYGVHSSSHVKVRPTRTVWNGEERHTVRYRRPGRNTARDRAIRESWAVAR